ncbi:MAG: chemotaxis protein CheA [Syntrophomonas sp.]|uniref:chemotaxis protein CheA n=1 Tax=Syntrophomonas sp. TaxID=2053627 RepID=UPI00260479C2|nr:chemotaxis protein CheA [Syntrophomonas sp.]MDD4627272.1 chemotaxis protein CheA [Syntrophomonas sp.]
MDKSLSKEPMLEMFIFENLQLLEQLEQTILAHEKERCLENAVINEIFRIMHTIKGSAAMMMYDSISSLAHAIEDLFFYIREFHPDEMDYSKICDMVLDGIDFIKNEIGKLEQDQEADGDSSPFVENIEQYLLLIKEASANSNLINEAAARPAGLQKKFYISTSKSPPTENIKRYHALIYFTPGCEMENIRAFNLVHKLKDQAEQIDYLPADIIENNDSVEFIRENGFAVIFTTHLQQEAINELFMKEAFIDSLDLRVMEDEEWEIEQLRARNQIILEDEEPTISNNRAKETGANLHSGGSRQSLINVNVDKLDRLMDMVGELVISETMVALNPDLTTATRLDNFHKATRQHRKIINELQDIVMSIRMVPLTMTFHKMNRIVRDMSKKQNKNVELVIRGEETEVDKKIIEHLSDPIMHLIRNAIDHGIESPEKRAGLGKSPIAQVYLEAKSEGGDVYIILRDDGAGLDKEKILERARARGLIQKPDSNLSDGEIFSTILLPGFSTCDEISEFSGRGVGMDVVLKNIEAIGGTVLVDSAPGQGTTISLKIPLTLAIINGMRVKVGNSIYIIPITSIKESFKAQRGDVIVDPNGKEMIMVRGECYPVLRLHKKYQVKSALEDISKGIIVIVQNDSGSICLFVDALLGEQQVVVKALPKFIGKIAGISACTLLGDGRACLIIDVANLINPSKS